MSFFLLLRDLRDIQRRRPPNGSQIRVSSFFIDNRYNQPDISKDKKPAGQVPAKKYDRPHASRSLTSEHSCFPLEFFPTKKQSFFPRDILLRHGHYKKYSQRTILSRVFLRAVKNYTYQSASSKKLTYSTIFLTRCFFAIVYCAQKSRDVSLQHFTARTIKKHAIFLCQNTPHVQFFITRHFFTILYCSQLHGNILVAMFLCNILLRAL